MAIKVVLAQAHQEQLADKEIERELCSVENEINRVQLPFKKNIINYVFVKGIYIHSERKMLTVCLFVNKMDTPITELHGVLRLKFKDKTAKIATTTLDFDKLFIGELNPGEALLVHVGIPVKGLTVDEEFTISNITGVFDEVRVTMT